MKCLNIKALSVVKALTVADTCSDFIALEHYCLFIKFLTWLFKTKQLSDVPCNQNENENNSYQSLKNYYEEIRQDQYEDLPSSFYVDITSGDDLTTSNTIGYLKEKNSSICNGTLLILS